MQFCNSQEEVCNTQFKILNTAQNFLEAILIFMRNPISNLGMGLFPTSAIMFQKLLTNIAQRKEREKIRTHSIEMFNLQHIFVPNSKY